MPVTKIGKQSFFHGKTLFEITRQFRNYGVGRMVLRMNFWKRYPEPSYYILTKVEPDMTCPHARRGVAYGLKVFRGENLGERKIDSGGKADWKLIPKEEEAEIIKLAENCQPRERNIIDPYIKFPPLLEDMIRQEMKDSGEDYTKPFILEKRLANGSFSRARLREPGAEA